MSIKIKIGNGFDVHQLADGLPFFICGVRVNHTKGAVAHSDGDVAIHALCDAILGALALGDIGKHFPDTSGEFKNIDSKILLEKVVEMMQNTRYMVGNVDITLMLEKPKIAPYISEMRSVLAGILNVALDQVSIKATTSEKLGFIGREEGVAAMASVLLTSI